MDFNLESFFALGGVEYQVFRNNSVIAKETGIPNHEKATSNKYIGFRPLTDIKPGDCLINPVNEKLYVVDIQTDIHRGQPFQLKAYYQTEVEYSAPTTPQSTIFNINNANNSVIGNNNVLNINYTDCLQKLKKSIENSNEADKEELSKIVSLLELIVEDNIPVKKGLLSKFSDIIAKHSWLASQITTLLLSWLTSQ